jgi:hypothetical protein
MPKSATDNGTPPNLFAPRLFPTDLDERIEALYNAHGVDYGDDDALLFALATTHVPGLSVKRAKHGPSQLWTPRQCAALKLAVDEHIAEKRRAFPDLKVSVAAACRHLAAKEPWKSTLRENKDPGAALRKQYDLAEDVWVTFVRDEQAFAQWEKEHPEEAAKRRWRSRLAELLLQNVPRE